MMAMPWLMPAPQHWTCVSAAALSSAAGAGKQERRTGRDLRPRLPCLTSFCFSVSLRAEAEPVCRLSRTGQQASTATTAAPLLPRLSLTPIFSGLRTGRGHCRVVSSTDERRAVPARSLLPRGTLDWFAAQLNAGRVRETSSAAHDQTLAISS
ncbi:hypothetical protein PRIC2_013014 [Phytophthora ramorum]